MKSQVSIQEHLSTWIFFTFWNIWKTRNDKVFSNVEPNPLNVLYAIKAQCSEFLSSTIPKPKDSSITGMHQQTHVQAPPVSWRPPQSTFVKLNCDAAFDKSTGKGFTGIICRDDRGTVFIATSRQFFACSSLVAEAISLRDAASLAANLGCNKVIFESNCQLLVEACRGNLIRGEIKGLVEDFNYIRKNFQFAGITWIKREGNQCAHVIASQAKGNQLSGTWL